MTHGTNRTPRHDALVPPEWADSAPASMSNCGCWAASALSVEYQLLVPLSADSSALLDLVGSG